MSSREEVLQHLFASMSKNKRLMHAHFQQAMRQLDFGISQAQAQILFTIEMHQPLSFKQLAHIVSSSPGAITQIVNPLVDRNYLTRTPDEKDRRIVYLSISDKGKELMQKLQATHEQLLIALTEELSEDEIRSWVNIQDKMIHYLETHTQKEKE